jgi:NAD-dependent dihydropyrimidine dehydrogenase PreA subunit
METARQIIEIDEALCDGCGDCVTSCHEGALAIVDGKARLVSEELCDGLGACLGECPQGAIRIIRVEPANMPESAPPQWPVQIRLVPPGAPFLSAEEWIVVADCVPVVAADFQKRYRTGRALLLGCPKFDDAEQNARHFAALFSRQVPRRVLVAIMPVPCCSGLPRLVRAGAAMAGVNVPIEVIRVDFEGREVGRGMLA